MKRIFLLAFLLIAGVTLYGQKSPVKFGKIDPENLKMSSYAQDSSAGAVVLFDWGFTTFDYNFEVSFQRHIRIKILNKSELGRADVKISHGRRDRLEKLHAFTYNLENGKMVTYEMDKKDVLEEKVDKYEDRTVFTLPNVQEGSIIEYTYRVNIGSWRTIRPWYFQKDIPVIYSEYQVELPEMFEYRKIMTGYIALNDADVKRKNISYQGTPLTLVSQRYLAKNVPAFKEESYMASTEDYISKIKFELATFIIPGKTVEKMMPDSYEQLSFKLATDDEVGKRLEKGRFLRDEVERILEGVTDPRERAEKIYSFVQNRFEIDHTFYEDNYKKIFDEKRGFSQDINFILIMMLKEAELNAELVLLSTRKNGRLHPFYPSLSNFNYVVGMVTIDGQEYLMDASDKYLPFAMVPKKCLNGKGLVISETNPRWVALKPEKGNIQMISASCELFADGSLQGDLKISRQGYTAVGFKRSYLEFEDDYEKDFADKVTWSIDKHDVDGIDSVSDRLSESIHMMDDDFAESLGDLIYLNPLVYGKTNSNPFKKDERLYPISFGAPVRELQTFRIIIPEEYMVDEIPQPLAIALPDNAGKFIYSVSASGRVITVTSQFQINRVEFGANDFLYLKAFYTQLIAKEAEQIVLKKKI